MKVDDLRQFSRPSAQIYSGVGLLVADVEKAGLTVNYQSYQMGIPVQTLQRQVNGERKMRLDLNAMSRHLWFFRRYFRRDLRPGNLVVLVENGRADLGERAIRRLFADAKPLDEKEEPLAGQRYLRFRFNDWIAESGRSVMEICLLAGLPYATGMRAKHTPWMDRIETNTLERVAAAFSITMRRPFTIDDLLDFPSRSRAEIAEGQINERADRERAKRD